MEAVTYDNLVILTGGDRVGKSTLLRKLKRHRPDWAVGSLEPGDWLPQAELPHLDWALSRHPRSFLHDLSPLARASTLLNFITCFYDYWLLPRLKTGQLVVVDSFYYRFYIKEKIKDIVPGFFYEALDALPNARLAIIASLEPELAFTRRDDFCVHEVHDDPGKKGFIEFQSAVGRELRALCMERCDTVREIDASKSEDAMLQAFVECVMAELEAGTQAG